MRDESEPIIVGRIIGIYGIKGWVKIMSYTRPRENILGYNPWLIRRQGDWQEIPLRAGRLHGKGIIAAFEDMTEKETVRPLLDADIAVYRSQLRPLEAEEYYWHDLLGAEVVNQQGTNLGKVVEILETGANDVLVVEGKDRHLIPYVREHYVLEIDLERNLIRVDWQ